MQRVRVSVSRLRQDNAGTVFEVFSNWGRGQVDYLHPATPRPVMLWPEAAPRDGHLLNGHLTARHLDSVDPDGHLEGVHLRGNHLYPALAVTFDTPAYVFGRFVHAVRMSDGAGNGSSASVVAITVNGAPTVPERVIRAGYNPETDQLILSFSASRFEPVPGK